MLATSKLGIYFLFEFRASISNAKLGFVVLMGLKHAIRTWFRGFQGQAAYLKGRIHEEEPQFQTWLSKLSSYC
jgi:hypothetical protein